MLIYCLSACFVSSKYILLFSQRWGLILWIQGIISRCSLLIKQSSVSSEAACFQGGSLLLLRTMTNNISYKHALWTRVSVSKIYGSNMCCVDAQKMFLVSFTFLNILVLFSFIVQNRFPATFFILPSHYYVIWVGKSLLFFFHIYFLYSLVLYTTFVYRIVFRALHPIL